MRNDVNYQDPETVGDTHEPDAGSEKRSRGINIPTVLASAGVAAVISALIVTIGVVGLAVSERNDSSTSPQPTVMNLGAAANPMQPQAVAGANQPGAVPGQPAPAAAPAPAPAAENVPESGGTVGAPPAANPAPAPAPAPGAATAPQQQQPAAAAAPTALTPGQLNTKVKIIMDARGSRAARIAELEGGERALRQIDAVAAAITTYGNVGLSYQMINPVQVSGTTMTAPLQISIVGRGSQNRSMTWVWNGTKWQLSNKSVCTIAGFLLLPCSL
ncbi:hypothetical protein IA539_19410 [Gordonia sp. zg691]|uniref:hypothetical protein n=1 Tax=Gordonia jinghuaiqii TaxID=2758710 RepID=UPI0016626BF8|nr:hypothetical protein [Gordonia jinghuaiqii]MBD0863344.1 hypothetical protein [Gordonia jinghuaiqii]